MISRLQQTLEQHCGVGPGASLLVALSGGGDSVALLHMLRRLAAAWPLQLAAAHLDHALRPESAADAAWIAELCQDWQIPLVTERIEVGMLAAEGRGNLEETARNLRHDFLLRVAAERGCELVVLGHHAGDQAETLLHRLLRGCGTAGLAGMAWRRGMLIRPLLETLPAELDSYRREQQLSWREDASNHDLELTRNRLRHQLLPLLREYNPEIVAGLAGLAGRLQLDEDYWRQQAADVFERLAEVSAAELQLPVAALLQLHPALRLRVLRVALEKQRGDLRGIDATHLRSLDELLAAERPQAELHLPQCWAARRYDRLWLRRAAPEAPESDEQLVTGPGCYRLPGVGCLEVAIGCGERGSSASQVSFDLRQVGFPLRVRPVRPGDRFRPSGMRGHKKVKDFWSDTRMTHEQRRRLLVLEGEEILWLIGERRCEGFWPEPGGEPALQLVFRRTEGLN